MMPVVAVLGGDNRVSRAQWPKGYTIRTYQSQMYGGSGESTRLRSAVQAGGIDAIVVLTRWVDHACFGWETERALFAHRIARKG